MLHFRVIQEYSGMLIESQINFGSMFYQQNFVKGKIFCLTIQKILSEKPLIL